MTWPDSKLPFAHKVCCSTVVKFLKFRGAAGHRFSHAFEKQETDFAPSQAFFKLLSFIMDAESMGVESGREYPYIPCVCTCEMSIAEISNFYEKK